MDAPAWLIQCAADVPPGEDWLGPAERRVMAGLRVPQRRAAWRLGRWTAKRAIGAWLSAGPSRIEILAAPDGAPEAWIDGARLGLSISLSHRGGRGLAVVAEAPLRVGCDLELVEPRSDAFVRGWFSADEQASLLGAAAPERALVANLIWTAKEAAAKVRREGLRLDVRRLMVTLPAGSALDGSWSPVGVEGLTGWCRRDSGWVMTVVCDPARAQPRPLHSIGP